MTMRLTGNAPANPMANPMANQMANPMERHSASSAWNSSHSRLERPLEA
jgi:hypothetical protein